MPHLVGDDGPELLRRQRLHQRQADLEVAHLPAQQAQLGDLQDARVEVPRHLDVVEARGAQGVGHLVQHGEQARGLGPSDLRLGGRRDRHPQGAQDQSDADQQKKAQLDRDEVRAAAADHGGDQ